MRKIATLSIGEDDLARVKAVVDKRNRLQHHGLEDTEAAVRSVAVAALDFLLTFIDHHLRDDDRSGPSGGVEASLERIRDRLSGIRHLVDTRMASLGPQLDAIEAVVECPSCRQPAFVPGEPCRCRFCLAQFDPEEAAEAHVEEVLGQSRYRAAKGRDEWDLYQCFGCGLESLVRGVQFRNQVLDDPHSPPMIWLCFADQQMWTAAEVGECFKCGQPTHFGDDGENSVWSDCFEYAALGSD